MTLCFVYPLVDSSGAACWAEGATRLSSCQVRHTHTNTHTLTLYEPHVLISRFFCSGPRCVALLDHEGEEEDELTFSQGDVIGLLELIGQEWGRGQIHGRIGKFPLNFTEVVEPLPTSVTELGETDKPALTDTAMTENSGELKAALSSSLHLYASLLWTTGFLFCKSKVA